MCEWTPPYETRPRRWTSPPRSRARRKTSVSTSLRANEPSATARFTRARSWSRILPDPIVRWPTSEFPICPDGSPTASPDCRQRGVRIPRHERVEDGCVGELDGVPRAGRGDPPAVEDDEADGRQAASAPARQIASNDWTSSDAPPTSAPSTSGSDRSVAAFSGFTEPP